MPARRRRTAMLLVLVGLVAGCGGDGDGAGKASKPAASESSRLDLGSISLVSPPGWRSAPEVNNTTRVNDQRSLAFFVPESVLQADESDRFLQVSQEEASSAEVRRFEKHATGTRRERRRTCRGYAAVGEGAKLAPKYQGLDEELADYAPGQRGLVFQCIHTYPAVNGVQITRMVVHDGRLYHLTGIARFNDQTEVHKAGTAILKSLRF